MCETILLLLVTGALGVGITTAVGATAKRRDQQKNNRRAQACIYHINQTGDHYRRQMNEASNVFLNKIHEKTRR